MPSPDAFYPKCPHGYQSHSNDITNKAHNNKRQALSISLLLIFSQASFLCLGLDQGSQISGSSLSDFYQVWLLSIYGPSQRESKKNGEECEENSCWSPPGSISMGWLWRYWPHLRLYWTSTRDQGLLALLPMVMLLMDDTLYSDDACGGRGVVFLD